MTKNIPLILIAGLIIWATLLRVWQLNTQMIFFGDAAHDILAARQAVIDKNLPLLGIESSVPRFRQGPVAVWIIMFSQLVFGLTNTTAIGLVFALIGIGALIGLYELMTIAINQKTAIISTALMTVFPMAVAHSRVPYHITPIPLAMVGFLWANWRLWQQQKYALPVAFFSWAVLFQFELALFPLIVVPIYVWWRQQQKVGKNDLILSSLALAVGLSPQIIFDLTHNFRHLGGFAIWMAYRIVAFGGYKQEHTFTLPRLLDTGETFWFYFRRMVSFDQNWLALLALIILLASFGYIWRQYQKRKLPGLMEISTISFLALTGAYVIHGHPSEAYFPPFLVLIPIIVSYFLGSIPKKWLSTLALGVTGYMLLNTWQIWNHNFFVSSNHPFSYGASIGEQRLVIKYLVEESDNAFQLNTTNQGGQFASYFDNLRWLHLEQEYGPVKTPNHFFYIETSDQTLNTYPSIKMVSFDTIHVYQLL